MTTKKAKKPKRTALQKHLSAIGKKGAQVTLERHGNEHMRSLANKRWSKTKKKV